jgi:MarR family transcriptional regulator, organic hydroperoxide resistance regulator
MSDRLLRDLKQTKPFANERIAVLVSLLRTTDLVSRPLEELLRPAELSHTTYNVLRILRGAGSQGLPCREIGARLVTREPDVTRLLDRLERRGLLTRSRDSSDRRVVTIRITEAGMALLDELDMDRRGYDALAPFFSGLSPADIDTLLRLLERLREAGEQPTRTTP